MRTEEGLSAPVSSGSSSLRSCRCSERNRRQKESRLLREEVQGSRASLHPAVSGATYLLIVDLRKRTMEGRRMSRCYIKEVSALLGCVWCLLNSVDCYNLDLDNSLHFGGPNGSLFGYSVLLHEVRGSPW